MLQGLKSRAVAAARGLETTLVRALTTRTRRLGARNYAVGRGLLDRPPRQEAFEPWIDAAYAGALAAFEGAVLDVGVNRMQSFFKFLSIDPDRRYLGVEPQLPAAMAVQDFIDRNDLTQAAILCAGLSEAPGTAVLNLRRGHGYDASASIVTLRPARFYTERRLAPLITGDSAVEALEIDAVALIKIDVEGAELEVLRGFSATLARHGPAVVFEVLNDWAAPGEDPQARAISAERDRRARAVSDLFAAAGYAILEVRSEGLRPTPAIERKVSADLALCNYAAVPTPKVEAFSAAFDAHRTAT
ncbi:MAG: FkbM family methyltransferase [Pseudomonadota bacterium]